MICTDACAHAVSGRAVVELEHDEICRTRTDHSKMWGHHQPVTLHSDGRRLKRQNEAAFHQALNGDCQPASQFSQPSLGLKRLLAASGARAYSGTGTGTVRHIRHPPSHPRPQTARFSWPSISSLHPQSPTLLLHLERFSRLVLMAHALPIAASDTRRLRRAMDAHPRPGLQPMCALLGPWQTRP